MITPQVKTAYPNNAHSSSTSSTVTSVSSSTETGSSSMKSVAQHPLRSTDASEEENESPTRGPSTSRAMSKMQLTERQHVQGSAKPVPARIPPVAIRPIRPPTKPVVIGGRTSAKFAKVAEDPGVEGVPPGPRSMDRPGPSFACIIGQAILKCSAGGLSLEHIYRYVETAYPYFKTGDGAWRNSVRHNLSIHKMFETIPRTEKFPPGKGGIWIIHEDEKCHWPEDNKFIKNFPATHPHQANCRQTLHERGKEREAMEKAAREGRAYVPKKGKKGRKATMKDEDDDGEEILRSLSALSQASPHLQEPLHQPEPMHQRNGFAPPLMGRAMQSSMGTADFDMEDEGDFLPMEDSSQPFSATSPSELPLLQERTFNRSGTIVPSRLDPERQRSRERKRKVPEEDENVFSSTKRVRVVAEPDPHTAYEYLDDSFITPERERPVPTSKGTWSIFKTPALVNTSSSPGSSPMPPTVTRTTHHPSALQQTWTQDDMVRSANDSSPQRAMLEEAFDFQPKSKGPLRARVLVNEDDHIPSNISPRAPPKTPLTRSSAAAEKTPRFHLAKTPMSRTPMLVGSPRLPPPSAGALLSTPLWEVGGCLDRLKNYGASPTHSIRSPMPPTSPTRYAMLLDSGGSPRKMRDFSL